MGVCGQLLDALNVNVGLAFRYEYPAHREEIMHWLTQHPYLANYRYLSIHLWIEVQEEVDAEMLEQVTTLSIPNLLVTLE